MRLGCGIEVADLHDLVLSARENDSIELPSGLSDLKGTTPPEAPIPSSVQGKNCGASNVGKPPRSEVKIFFPQSSSSSEGVVASPREEVWKLVV